jgi:ABC-type multidrug transport system fused ATPase/permease subunit
MEYLGGYLYIVIIVITSVGVELTSLWKDYELGKWAEAKDQKENLKYYGGM